MRTTDDDAIPDETQGPGEPSLGDPDSLREFVANIAEGIYITTPDGRLLDANEAVLRIFGVDTLEELQSKPVERLLVDPERREEKKRLIREQGRVRDFEFEVRRADGERRVVLDNCFARRDSGGEVVAYFGILRDVTERRRAERERRASLALFESLIENLHVGVLFETDERKVFSVNRRFCSLFGIPAAPSELVGADCREAARRSMDLVEEPEEFIDRIEELVERREPVAAEEIRFADGRVIERDYVPISAASHGRGGHVWIYRDVTDRRKEEERRRRSHKLESLGQLAGGIAHDFNNLLTGIVGYAELLLGRLDDESPLADDAREIREIAGRASDLTQQLLAFARRQRLDARILDVDEVIEDTCRLLERSIGEHIEVEFVPDGDLHEVRADRAQIQQVLVNLAINARDAMPDGGRLEIRSGNVELEAPEEGAPRDLEQGAYVEIVVEDEGAGLKPETAERIFDPFFTTKEVPESTGLGLATAYGIVKQHGGTMRVASVPDGGTRFEILLPAAEEVEIEPETETANADPEPSVRGAAILVVEDEEAVRAVAERILADRGYRVYSAARPEEAEALFERRGDEIDLLLTDVVMPGCDGPELYRRLSKERPTLAVLYISGYADLEGRREELDGALLEKPFDPDVLCERVRAVLEEGTG